MTDLFTAIKTEFDGNADLVGALTGGLYLQQAPQNTAFPYGIYFLVANVPEWTFTENVETAVIQFSLFDYDEDNPLSATIICDAYTKLQACYDWCTLTISNYTSIYMKRELGRLLRTEGVWQYSVDYRCYIQET